MEGRGGGGSAWGVGIQTVVKEFEYRCVIIQTQAHSRHDKVTARQSYTKELTTLQWMVCYSDKWVFFNNSRCLCNQMLVRGLMQLDKDRTLA